MRFIKARISSVILLAFILIFGLIYILYANSIMASITEDFLGDMIDKSTDAFSQNIKSKIKYVEALAAMDVMTNDSVPFEKKLEGLESLISQADFTRLLLIDRNGNGITNNGEQVSISGREYLSLSLNGKSNFSYPLISVFGEQWVSVVAVPVKNDESDIIYALATGVNEHGFVSLYENADTIYKSKAYIIGEKFDYMLEYNKTDDSYEIDLITDFSQLKTLNDERAVIADIIMAHSSKGDVGYDEYVYNGVHKYLAYSNIEETDFIFIAAIEKNTVFNEIRNAVIVSNSIMLFILIILSALIYYNAGLSENIKLQQEKTGLAVDITKLMIIEINKDKNKIISANKHALQLLGYTENEFRNKDALSLLKVDMQPEKFWMYVDENMIKKGSSSMQMPIIKRDGTKVYVLWKAAVIGEGIYEFFGSDISELKKSQEQVNQLAFYDQLTGLNNRISLEEYLSTILNGNAARFAFIHLDIDNFKYVNDTFDHHFGDKILVEMSSRISRFNESMPPNKIKVFRIAGDEFVVIYQNFYDYGEVGDYSNMLFNTVSQEYDLESIKISITVSIGISIYPDYSTDLPDIFKTSEIAMINAKEMGKSRVVFFNKAMKKELETIVYMAADLEEAFKKREFVLYYQPQYDIQTGQIYGYEALMRWISHKRGLVPPNQFIPYAERSHIINKMGLWAFEEAAKFSNELRKMGYEDIKISVNVSVVQLLDEGFVNDILSIIEKTKALPHNMCMELTESVMMESIETSLIKINHLNEAGIRFSLDDFGTGYSSLTYLKKLPVDVLKIDKSFIDTIMKKDNFADNQIIVAIINMARTINLKVVAEGVEEKEQWDWLKEKGCDICQGYYTGRPLPKAEALQGLRR